MAGMQEMHGQVAGAHGHQELVSRASGVAEFVGFLEDGSEQWHAHRNDGIGASSVSVAMGMNPWKSAVQEWAERTGRQEPEIPSPDRQELFTWGHLLETSITMRFEMFFPQYEVFDTGSWRNKKRTWQTANPDRIYYDPARDTYGVVEIKTSGRGVGWRGELPPLYYLAQLRDQLSTLGLEEGYLICLVGNSETLLYKVHLDVNKPIINCMTGERVYERTVTERAIIECCEGFLECVATDTMPRIDGSVSAWQTVQALGNTGDKSHTYDTGQEVRDLIVSRYQAKEEATEAYNQARSQLFHDMGDATKARYKSSDGTMIPFAARRKGPGGKYSLYLTDKK